MALAPSELSEIKRCSDRNLEILTDRMNQNDSSTERRQFATLIRAERNWPIFCALCYELILRTGYTAQRLRETEPQQQALARAALSDAIEAMGKQRSRQAAVLQEERARNPIPLVNFVLELVKGCRCQTTAGPGVGKGIRSLDMDERPLNDGTVRALPATAIATALP